MGILKIFMKKHGGSAFTLIICGGILLIFFPPSGRSTIYQPDPKQPTSNLTSQPVQPASGKQTQATRPREKYIGEFMKLPADPIEITEVKVKGKATETNKYLKEFNESGNWLEGLSFKVKNNSGRDIVYLSIYLTFPETKDDRNSPTLSFPLEFGTNPQWKTLPANLEPLSPNQEIEFSISGEKYAALDRFISRKKPIDSINVLILRKVRVIFDNESGWDTGVYIRRDPQNPQKWIDVN